MKEKYKSHTHTHALKGGRVDGEGEGKWPHTALEPVLLKYWSEEIDLESLNLLSELSILVEEVLVVLWNNDNNNHIKHTKTVK